MQLNKKIYTTLIIAILAISTMISVIPFASAEITTVPYAVVVDGTAPLTTGPVGTKVDIVGNTTSGAASPFSTVKAYWDSLSGAVLGTASADVNGAYRITVTIPPAVYGTHYIVVNDGETESEGAAFDVTGQLIVATIPPTVGMPKVLPGDQLTVTGHGFAANDAITLFFNSTTLTTPVDFVITTPAITSNGTGSFSATITVPATLTLDDFDIYDVTARDLDLNTATAQVNIDYYIGCMPAAGPVGITTTISGRIAPSTAYTIRFNGATIATGTSAADGSYSTMYTIPAVLSTGPYTVDVLWETVNTRDTTFTINPSPTITLGAPNGFAGNVVSVIGSGFSGSASVTLYFGTTIVNSTSTGFGPTSAAGALPDGSSFVIPSLAPGIYAVSVVDQYGATSNSVVFTIDPSPVTTVSLRAMTYYPMDIISFNIYTTDAFTLGPVVTIRDPSGAVWWTGTWALVPSGSTWVMPYMDQMINGNYLQLSADCPLGTWNWTITYTATIAGAKKATGLFSVMEEPTMQTVLDRLDDMEATITDVITTTENDIIAVINTKTGTIMTSLSNLDVSAQLTSIDNGIATISTTLGDVQTSIDSLSMDALGADITSIKNGVATIQTNLGTVNTAVSNLAAKVTDIQGDVATVITNLGTLDGKVTAIDGKVATVETSVGTIQADVSDVQAKADQTPVWIAVVLSLVAAIAAIFAVITIRQKIAG